MGKLKEYAKDAQQYVRLDDGESIEVVFKAFKIVPNKFDPDKDTVRYYFLIEGKEKEWENGAAYVAEFFDNIKEGEAVSITRRGEGNKTKYELKALIS